MSEVIEIKKPGLLTPRQACEYLGGKLKPATLANWRTRNIGPNFVKIGRDVFYPQEELDLYIEQQKVVTRAS